MRFVSIMALACCAWAQADWRETEIDGRKIRYQAVQGEAVWQGDIVLGPVESVGKGSRASAVVNGQRLRWTNNSMPYVIDDQVPEKERVEGAIRHWNENTPMRLTPRQNETNYVQFRQRNGAACSSNVGMIGGRQFINLPDDCTLGSIIHEIGHAAGLFHTQSRGDRDLFIRVNEDGIERDSLSQYAQQIAGTDDVGAYPYDSIMHYSVGGFALAGNVAMETIPAGIPLGQRDGLTASDIDTVIRIQGGQPARTVIASNPSGLEATVDGERVRTPAAFDWPVGSRHTLSVADVTIDNAELRFGRWSDFGDRTHTVVASADATVFTAHMRRLFRLPVAANPAAGGRVAVRPETEDGLIPDGRRTELQAEPAEGFAFTNWSGFGFFSTHGSANPIRFPMSSPQLTYTASFSRSALTTVTTAPPGLRIVVDGTASTSPRQFVWTAGTRHDISIETVNQTTLGGAATHAFRAWSDGGGQRHSVTAAADGGTVTAEFDTQYQVLTAASPMAGGSVVIDPPPVNGFLPAGAAVTITAAPNNGFAFAGWGGNLPGGEARKSVTVEGVLDVQARFAQPATLTAAGLVNGATFISGPIAPGQIVTLFGLDLGPDELAGLTLTAQGRVATIAGGVRVLFDGTPAPALYASARQVGVIVPFNVAGKSVVRVQLDNGGRLTNPLTMSVAAAAPGFFTANSAGRGGGAFLNSDGSLNTEANAAERGSIVVLYATGLGTMRPAVNDGELAAPPYAQPAAPYTVRIADRECEVLYGGAAPGLVAGLVQLNVRVPADIAPGVVPVSLEVDGIRSPRTVSVAVR
ncbi:MAG: M12 family metallopeptidase [Bryobacteraceae bacterium]